MIEDPDVIIYNDACRDAKLTSMDPKSLDGSDIDLRRMFEHQRLERAQAFDARYPDPEALLRNRMNQNETSGARTAASSPAPTKAPATRHPNTVRDLAAWLGGEQVVLGPGLC